MLQRINMCFPSSSDSEVPYVSWFAHSAHIWHQCPPWSDEDLFRMWWSKVTGTSPPTRSFTRDISGTAWGGISSGLAPTSTSTKNTRNTFVDLCQEFDRDSSFGSTLFLWSQMPWEEGGRSWCPAIYKQLYPWITSCPRIGLQHCSPLFDPVWWSLIYREFFWVAESHSFNIHTLGRPVQEEGRYVLFYILH